MTIENLHELLKRLSMYLYDCSGAEAEHKEKGVKIEVTEREIIALAVGLNCADVFCTMEPQKPVAEMTAEDIKGLATTCAGMLIKTYYKIDELND